MLKDNYFNTPRFNFLVDPTWRKHVLHSQDEVRLDSNVWLLIWGMSCAPLSQRSFRLQQKTNERANLERKFFLRAILSKTKNLHPMIIHFAFHQIWFIAMKRFEPGSSDHPSSDHPSSDHPSGQLTLLRLFVFFILRSGTFRSFSSRHDRFRIFYANTR